jgi:hypothetical protein
MASTQDKQKRAEEEKTPFSLSIVDLTPFPSSMSKRLGSRNENYSK